MYTNMGTCSLRVGRRQRAQEHKHRFVGSGQQANFLPGGEGGVAVVLQETQEKALNWKVLGTTGKEGPQPETLKH